MVNSCNIPAMKLMLFSDERITQMQILLRIFWKRIYKYTDLGEKKNLDVKGFQA